MPSKSSHSSLLSEETQLWTWVFKPTRRGIFANSTLDYLPPQAASLNQVKSLLNSPRKKAASARHRTRKFRGISVIIQQLMSTSRSLKSTTSSKTTKVTIVVPLNLSRSQRIRYTLTQTSNLSRARQCVSTMMATLGWGPVNRRPFLAMAHPLKTNPIQIIKVSACLRVFSPNSFLEVWFDWQ